MVYFALLLVKYEARYVIDLAVSNESVRDAAAPLSQTC